MNTKVFVCHVLTISYQSSPPTVSVKSAKSHFFSVEGQIQLLESRTVSRQARITPHASPPSAQDSQAALQAVFPALAHQPHPYSESIHANTCYPEQLSRQEKIAKVGEI